MSSSFWKQQTQRYQQFRSWWWSSSSYFGLMKLNPQLLAVTIFILLSTPVSSEVCEIETGQTNVIVDMEESRGQQTNQSTRPRLLPIAGDVDTEMSLQVVAPGGGGGGQFILIGKELRLGTPLDRDERDISSLIVQVSCTDRVTQRRRNIPVIVRISDVNDNRPEFILPLPPPVAVSIPEDLAVESVVISKDLIEAKDADAGINALVEYRIVPSIPSAADADAADGYGTFQFASPHEAVVTLVKPLDYESVRRYVLTVVASDRAFNVKERLSSTATLTVQVTDVNDQDPVFIYPNCPLNQLRVCETTPTYTAEVTSGAVAGLLLNLKPTERIQAVDTDPSSKSQIRYSFQPASDYFEIHATSGWIRQIRPIEEEQEKLMTPLTIKAEEMGANGRSSSAQLVIAVRPVDAHLPRIIAADSSSFDGIVQENSPLGTRVTSLSRQSTPMRLRIIDDDLPGSVADKDVSDFYTIELTSPLFRVNTEGFVQVAASDGQLDRDPPNPSTLTFQATARPISSNKNASSMTTAPVSISIRLTDVNDNSPRFPPSALKPLMVPAGDAKRTIGQVQAEDKDWADNARIDYSLIDVSGTGRNKFTVDRSTGVIDAVGALYSGDKFILSIQAMDGGGLSTIGTIQVSVISGPNLRPPSFAKELYEINVSEAAAPGSLVYSFHAEDPERGAVFYSIVSGNELSHFVMDRYNGSLLVAPAGVGVGTTIDREQLSRYSLTVKAEDVDALSTLTRANIRVLDVNDCDPTFVHLPYVFSVRENDPSTNGYIGRVQAKDADQDVNAKVNYAIGVEPNQSQLFAINAETGEIKSLKPLDYEKERVHRVIVTAIDGGFPPRQSTATVTVMVIDVADERPQFRQSKYDAQVAENGGADVFIAQVEADDRDSESKVTYILKQGDADKFSVDPLTGVVRTKRPLDYERQSRHVLVIGTQENSDANDPMATTTLVVNVQDRNDFAPVFSGLNPRPVRLQNTAPVGQLVTTVSAVDSDATAPNNQIRYELVTAGSSAKTSQLFRVDAQTGVVSTRDNLRKDSARQYQFEIRAFDLGQPTLSSSIRLTVLVEQVEPPLGVESQQQQITSSSSSFFAEMSYAVSVAEDALVHTLIKNLSLVGGGGGVGGGSNCVISSGNEADTFYIKGDQLRSCELRLKRPLDYETVTSYSIGIRLLSPNGVALDSDAEDKAATRVDVAVIDVNDNSPRFVFKYPENGHAGAAGKYYAALSSDAPISSVLIQVHADDLDSGALGGQQLVYDIMEASNVGGYFSIERTNGKITTDKMINTIGRLPLRLVVTARDNPGQPIGYRETSCQVVVNVIHPMHRLVIVLPTTPPDQVLRLQSSIIAVLQDETRLIVRLERLQARSHVQANGTIHLDESGSEFWFYCVDPSTETILQSNHTLINRSLIDFGATKHLIDLLANKLKLDVTEIRPPLPTAAITTSILQPSAVLTAKFWDGLPAALVVVAVLVFLLALGGIIYLCATWDVMKKNQFHRHQPSYVVFPSFNPLAVVQDPNPKEYETQILQLSVNNSTDESVGSSGEFHHPTRRSHVFPGGSTNANDSDDIATLRISSLAGSGNCEFAPHQFFSGGGGGSVDCYDHNITDGGGGGDGIPTANPLYEGSDEDPLNYTSATNTNVTFRPTFRSKLARLGIPEVSTEL